MIKNYAQNEGNVISDNPDSNLSRKGGIPPGPPSSTCGPDGLRCQAVHVPCDRTTIHLESKYAPPGHPSNSHLVDDIYNFVN
jgi:hypothetical protein